MTLYAILFVVAIAQVAFLFLLAVLLRRNRALAWRNKKALERATSVTEPPARNWLAGSGGVAPVRAALASLSADAAAGQVLRIAERVPMAQVEELAAEVRDEPWVDAALARARSRFWWRRIEAARLIAVTGTSRDVDRLKALLRDPNAAVQAVAAAAVPRLGDGECIDILLDALPDQSGFVQKAQHAVLATHWMAIAPRLTERLVQADAAPHELIAWLWLSSAVGTPDLLSAAVHHRGHADPEVRVAVARAMRRYLHPDGLATIKLLLQDKDWRVRAKAAQSLGAFGGPDAIGALTRALSDASWWVRYRTALALAQMGEPGRHALRDARASSDRFVADMAVMVSGLTPGAVMELAEG